MKKYIYICKIKLIGSQFAVEDEELANGWVKLDPEMNYYERIEIIYEL